MKRLALFACLTLLGVGVAFGQEQEPGFSWVNSLPDSANQRLQHATFYSLSMNGRVGRSRLLATRRLDSVAQRDTINQ